MNDMALPHGKTCLDCHHWARCLGLGTAKLGQVECDWSPSRFRDRSDACRDGEGNVSHDFIGDHCIKCGRLVET